MKPEYTAIAINNVLDGINNCPIPVLVEHPDGQEFPIVKAYRITGRTAAIKILVDRESETIHLREKIEELEEQIKNHASEIQDAKDEKDDAQEELKNWTDAFGDDPETTKTLWNEIEEAVKSFGQIAEINLVANDARNISKLQKEYEYKAQLLSEADEIVAELREEVAELKVENRALAWDIEQLEGK
jgi:chromosome segregation ATPase